jgi:non-ribosomal peptide synthetase-like protein
MVERSVQVFLPLRPLYCSIYDRRFWRHERFWKGAAATAYVQFFNGTPIKNLIWRMLGVRIGRRVFDDGCGIPEKTLVTIGDDATLNIGSTIQCHSQEDGAFKSERITIGTGCTVGIGAWVHYGVTVGDGATIGPDAFLMKGEDVPAHAIWAGNPARDLRDDRAASQMIRGTGDNKPSHVLVSEA